METQNTTLPQLVLPSEIQVLQVSGKTVPDQNDHLIQTYLDMENERDLNPRK